MKIIGTARFPVLFLTLFLLTGSIRAAEAGIEFTVGGPDNPTVTVVMRTPEPREEFDYILSALKNMDFYRKYGYAVSLPENNEFEKATQKAPDLDGMDLKALYNCFTTDVYARSDYRAGRAALDKTIPVVRPALARLIDLRDDWGFVLHPRYEVILSLYGPGGSYYPETGRVMLMTTPMGRFKRKNPAHTIVHEMVHLGIQKPIVARFGLKHREKERIVDLICTLYLGDLLDGYQVNTRDNVSLDGLVTAAAIRDLPAAVRTYVQSGSAEDTTASRTKVVILDVRPNSQAALKGFEPGDVILSYGGLEIRSPEGLVEAVKKMKTQSKVELIVLRKERTLQFIVQGGSLGVRVGRQ